MKAGKQEQAMRAYKEAQRIDPSDKAVARWLSAEIVRLGDAWFEAKDYSAALEHFLAALEIDPSDVTIWRKLGWTYYRLDRNQDTIDAFLEAYRLDPTDIELKKWLQTITKDQN